MTYRFDPERPRVPSVPPTVHGQMVPGPAQLPDAGVRLRIPASRSAALASFRAVHNDGLVLASPFHAGLAGDANHPVGAPAHLTAISPRRDREAAWAHA